MKARILMAFLVVFAAVSALALDESVPEIQERISNGWWQVDCHQPGTNGNARTYRAYSFGETIDWDWSDVRDVGPGTKLVSLATRADGKPNKIYVVRVDLKTPRLDIVGSIRCERWGSPMTDVDHVRTIRTLRETTADFMVRSRASSGRLARQSPVFLALNGAAWRPWNTVRDTCSTYAEPQSPLYSFGEQISVEGTGYGAHGSAENPQGIFVFYNDRTADIIPRVTKEIAKRIRFSVPCFTCRLLADGKPWPVPPFRKSPRGQRTSLGLSKTRQYLYIVVCDGRDKNWSVGLTFRELADLHKAAGSWDAINLDGGGSTTLLTWDAKRNCPYMHNWQKVPRRNGSNIGISQSAGTQPE